jgi:hypothetical protein
MKFENGLFVTEESFKFHIEAKNCLREMIAADPDADGTALDKIIDMPINDSWSKYEQGDGGLIKNEGFMTSMLDNYFKLMPEFKGTKKDEVVATKMCKFTMALYRNDSAYFERIGGVGNFVIKNIDKFAVVKNAPLEDYSKLLITVYKWWKDNDKRKRTKSWIAWMFIYVIKKYKTNMFYRRSINWAIIFMVLNAKLWQDDPTFNPDNWFPNKRGKFANALYGGTF